MNQNKPETHDTRDDVTTKQHPTRLMAGIYLTLGIGALVLISRPETDTLARYALGIAVEIALALMALVFIRLEDLSIPQTARLRLPGRQQVLMALAIVPGMWMTGVLLNVLSMLILGYSTPVTPAMFPRNAPEAIALALTTMVVAPVAEEIMFRGYIQRAFERPGPWPGVIAGGLIFALYHLRFQGVFALVPIALALGFVAWRTRSLLPTIAMHAAYNTIATVLLITTSFLPMEVVGGLTGMLVCFGILITPVSYVALWLLWQRTQPPQLSPAPPQRRWLRWAWAVPMILLLGIYGYAAGTELLVSRFPETFLNNVIELTAPADWQETHRWDYTVRNPLGRELGTATCTRSVDDDRFGLSCQADHEGFDLADEMPGLAGGLRSIEDLPYDLPAAAAAMLYTEAKTWSLEATWTDEALALEELTSDEEVSERQLRLSYVAGKAEVTLRNPDGDTTADTVSTASAEEGLILMPHEWAWRLSAMPLELPYGGEAVLVQTTDAGSIRLYDAFVQVAGGEPVWTPSGNYVTWKVTVSYADASDQERTLAAWYDSEAPHKLVRYDDGAVSYLLSQTESAGWTRESLSRSEKRRSAP
ncbi:MAG: CPBP family intramembrane glutamic endopeptidase [Anaerolineae bacterium]